MPETESFSRNDFKDFWAGIEEGAEYPLRVTGSSMYPFLIHDQSTVYIKKPESYNFKKGQILLFERPDGSFVLHRVFRVVDGDKLLMNGDHLTWHELIPAKAVCAAAARIKRKNHVISADSFVYKALVGLWMLLYPRRAAILKIGHKLRALFRHK